MSIIELLFKLIVCHLLGDYPLQIDYIAKTKGENNLFASTGDTTLQYPKFG